MKHIDISQTDAPRQKPYAKLRGLLKEYDYTQADIARKLGCGTILDMFRIDHSELTTYFPAGGYAA